MQLEPLTTKNFELFESLFSGKDSGGCYCAVWRSFDDTWVSRCNSADKQNLEITRKNVEQGLHIGYLVFEKEELIGWTGSGPKTEFPILETKLGSRLTPFSPSIWSIGCFSIKQAFRGKSKSTQVVKSLIEAAKINEAEYIEAYPTDPWDEPRSYRGSLRLFEKMGFVRFGDEADENSKIVCMRLKL